MAKLPSNYPKSAKINAATNNIPTAFSTAVGSQALTALSGNEYSHLMVLNETAGRICVIFDTSATTAPSSSSTAKLYVPADGAATFDEMSVFDTLYVQSDTGSAITTGTVEFMVW